MGDFANPAWRFCPTKYSFFFDDLNIAMDFDGCLMDVQ
jgi:hypothetical protein